MTSLRRVAAAITGATGLLAAITLLARVTGFGRTVVFVQTVGAGCVGSVYTTANSVPNLVFDLVAGGLLYSVVVPALAPAFAASDLPRAQQAFSALLGWASLVTATLAGLLLIVAPAVSRLLVGLADCPGAATAGAAMLRMFAPQLLFYAIAAVAGGALQASGRFGWPAAAPLLSSLVVVGAYLGYGHLTADGANRPAGSVPGQPTSLVLLGVGTTAGVAVLGLCLIPPLWRTGLRLRVSLRLPPAMAPVMWPAAIASAVVVAAQQTAAMVVLRLANGVRAPGAVVVLSLAQTVSLLPVAVLALPVAAVAYPRLVTAWEQHDGAHFATTLGRALHSVTAGAAVGTALLLATGPALVPLLFSSALVPAPARAQFAPALAGFALGLLGWSVVAVLTRALFATATTRALRTAAAAQLVGQLVIIVTDLTLSVLVSSTHRATVLGLGNAAGALAAASWLLVAVHRRGVPIPVRLLGNRVSAAGIGGASGWMIGRLAGPTTSAVMSWGWLLAAASTAAVVTGGLLLLGARPLPRLAGTA